MGVQDIKTISHTSLVPQNNQTFSDFSSWWLCWVLAWCKYKLPAWQSYQSIYFKNSLQTQKWMETLFSTLCVCRMISSRKWPLEVRSSNPLHTTSKLLPQKETCNLYRGLPGHFCLHKSALKSPPHYSFSKKVLSRIIA